MIKRLHKTIGIRAFLILGICGTAIVTSTFYFLSSEKQAEAYPVGCVTAACHEAADRASAAEQAASVAAANAQTLEGEVARLNAEIASLEAEIAANQAIASDLSVQISENEAKLNLQQAALAKLLVSMHFEDEPDAIILLASSNSIGDFAEKQSRQATAKSQIATSAEAVRELKEDLQRQKDSVDALIASAEIKNAQISQKRNEQNELRRKYENDSDAYARDAIANREKMQQEIAAEIARYNNGGVSGSGYNSYPYANRCPQDNLSQIVIGGYICQCVSYTAWKVQEFWGITISNWGNGSDWGNSARASGYVVNSTPAAHTVAYSTAGYYGHVMWVESVNSNGTINLTEYNNSSSSASGLPGDFGARYNVNPAAYRYIHFDQRTW